MKKYNLWNYIPSEIVTNDPNQFAADHMLEINNIIMPAIVRAMKRSPLYRDMFHKASNNRPGITKTAGDDGEMEDLHDFAYEGQIDEAYDVSESRRREEEDAESYDESKLSDEEIREKRREERKRAKKNKGINDEDETDSLDEYDKEMAPAKNYSQVEGEIFDVRSAFFAGLSYDNQQITPTLPEILAGYKPEAEAGLVDGIDVIYQRVDDINQPFCKKCLDEGRGMVSWFAHQAGNSLPAYPPEAVENFQSISEIKYRTRDALESFNKTNALSMSDTMYAPPIHKDAGIPYLGSSKDKTDMRCGGISGKVIAVHENFPPGTRKSGQAALAQELQDSTGGMLRPVEVDPNATTVTYTESCSATPNLMKLSSWIYGYVDKFCKLYFSSKRDEDSGAGKDSMIHVFKDDAGHWVEVAGKSQVQARCTQCNEVKSTEIKVCLTESDDVCPLHNKKVNTSDRFCQSCKEKLTLVEQLKVYSIPKSMQSVSLDAPVGDGSGEDKERSLSDTISDSETSPFDQSLMSTDEHHQLDTAFKDLIEADLIPQRLYDQYKLINSLYQDQEEFMPSYEKRVVQVGDEMKTEIQPIYKKRYDQETQEEVEERQRSGEEVFRKFLLEQYKIAPPHTVCDDCQAGDPTMHESRPGSWEDLASLSVPTLYVMPDSFDECITIKNHAPAEEHLVDSNGQLLSEKYGVSKTASKKLFIVAEDDDDDDEDEDDDFFAGITPPPVDTEPEFATIPDVVESKSGPALKQAIMNSNHPDKERDLQVLEGKNLSYRTDSFRANGETITIVGPYSSDWGLKQVHTMEGLIKAQIQSVWEDIQTEFPEYEKMFEALFLN